MKKEIKIGLVAVAGLVLLFFGMNYLKGMNIFSTDTKYYLSLKDISGLTASSPIYADGFKVGVVKSINYDYEKPGNIKIEAGIDPSLHIPEGSTAEIVSDLLGNIKLELVLGPNAYDLVEPGDTITGGLQSGVMGMAAGMVPQIQKMLPKLDSILANVNMLLSDPALKNSLHNIDDITANLKKTSNELNTMTASLNNQMPSMLKNADGMLANANDLTRNLNELDLASTMAKVNQTLQNVEEMTAKLNSNEGTLGLLMRDPQLYNNLNSTMMHADSLVIDLKQHPKRYVHFSVFGKKDK
jgi:phospholipid/cholesterol/gamma-HCH transport system substrate-binding protein